MPRVSRLRIYPIKSCRGNDVEIAALDALGIIGDRRFQVVDETGKPFTQRSHSALARVDAQLRGEKLQVSAVGIGEFVFNTQESTATELIETEVWSATGLQASPTTTAADEFFSTLLAAPARLVQAGSAFDRPVQNHPESRVGFADGYPLLVISEASLADLNDRLLERGEAAVAMERFRPNLVVSECPPFAEDSWSRLQIGDVHLAAAGPCERCIMTTLDPVTGERMGSEPLRTLATYRRATDGSGVNFGQNLVNLTTAGEIRVGDAVVSDSSTRHRVSL